MLFSIIVSSVEHDLVLRDLSSGHVHVKNEY